MGFCFFNNAGLAARAAQASIAWPCVRCCHLSHPWHGYCQGSPAAALCKHISFNRPFKNASADSRHPSLQAAGARKVLILDWDVHHGELKDFAQLELHPFRN